MSLVSAFYNVCTLFGASFALAISHIARYVPSINHKTCIQIEHNHYKNNFDHLLTVTSLPRL